MASSQPPITEIVYQPEATPRLFHGSDAFVRGIMGPLGSGKSTACVMEVYTRAVEQQAYQGVRRSRWAVIRSTYPDLLDTTIRTWTDWVPESICPITRTAPPHGTMKIKIADGTTVHMEVIFLALDQEDDIHKLKSLELTGAWINEAGEIPKGILDMLRARVNRFPAKRIGGCTWSGVIMDTNPPDDESWWYKLAEEEQPEGFRFFRQPPAVIPIPRKSVDDPQQYAPNQGQSSYPPAENVANHNAGYGYWMKLVAGSDEEWIKVFLMGEYGSVMGGKPVYPEYSDSLHCAKADIEPYRGLPIIVGIDFGLTPAAVISQLSPQGQFRILDEIIGEDMGIRSFTRDVLRPFLRNHYHTMPIESRCDPAGAQRSQTTEVTCIQIMREEGMEVQMASTNEFQARKDAISRFLSRLVAGEPGLRVSPRCKVIRKGFLGGYQYRPLKTSSGITYAKNARPLKNAFSHPHDALQYAALGIEDPMRRTSRMPFSSQRTPKIKTRSGLGWT